MGTTGAFWFSSRDPNVAGYQYTLNQDPSEVVDVTSGQVGKVVLRPLMPGPNELTVEDFVETPSGPLYSQPKTYVFNLADRPFSNGQSGDLPGDLNGDGIPDVLLATAGPGIDFREGRTGPTLGGGVVTTSGVPDLNGAQLAWDADLTGYLGQNGLRDGYNDLLYHLPGNANLNIVPGSGFGGFKWQYTFSVSAPSCAQGPTSFAGVTQVIDGYFDGATIYDSWNTAEVAQADVIVYDTSTDGYWLYSWVIPGSLGCPVALTGLDRAAAADGGPPTLVNPNVADSSSNCATAASACPTPRPTGGGAFGDLWARGKAGHVHLYTPTVTNGNVTAYAGQAPSISGLTLVVPPAKYPDLIAGGPYNGGTSSYLVTASSTDTHVRLLDAG